MVRGWGAVKEQSNKPLKLKIAQLTIKHPLKNDRSAMALANCHLRCMLSTSLVQLWQFTALSLLRRKFLLVVHVARRAIMAHVAQI